MPTVSIEREAYTQDDFRGRKIMVHRSMTKTVAAAIQKKVSPVEIATVFYPRIEAALELAQTSEEANEIRTQIETVNTYLKRELPKYIKDRRKEFENTHKGDMLYLQASAKAGQLWEKCEDKMPSHRPSNNCKNLYTSATDAGFKGRADSMTCQRIGEILDTEDWRVYSEETFENMRQPTLYGAECVWKMLFKAEPPEPIEGKYRIIYADPPWSYSNARFGGTTTPDDYYDLMTIKELCEMPVKEALEDNAVLFLWVTSPLLKEAFEVIEAWGFEYKTSFVWDKIKHNMGHYNSVRHEFLLVCTRGSCQPDTMRLFDSVVSVERNRHSEKPEEFREIIDTLYPNGNRIELFARKEVAGWDAYGNEVGN